MYDNEPKASAKESAALATGGAPATALDTAGEAEVSAHYWGRTPSPQEDPMCNSITRSITLKTTGGTEVVARLTSHLPRASLTA